MNHPALMLEDTLTMYDGDKVLTIHKTDPFWKDAKEAYYRRDYEAVQNLIDREKAVKNWLSSSPEMSLDGENFCYNGIPVDESLSGRILDMIKEGFSVKPLLNFLNNLMKNPSSRAINELYRFLSSNHLPITADGCFMAYKRITSDWKDCHTREIDNSIGAIVKMDRRKVDDNPNHTCSTGLHACSLEYLKSFYGDRLVGVKIDPKDVVSIPLDYNNSKMRVCEYKVMEELDISIVGGNKDFWDTPVVDYSPTNDNETLPVISAFEIRMYVNGVENFEDPENYPYIAADGDGSVYIYEEMPTKERGDTSWEPPNASKFKHIGQNHNLDPNQVYELWT